MEQNFQSTQRFQIATNIVITELDGESVLLDSHSGQYFGLNHAGNFILKQINQNVDFSSICQALSNHFEIELSQANIDTSELLNQLLEQKILSV